MTSETHAPASGAPALLDRWERASLETVWLRPSDWYTPATEAVVEALEARLDTAPHAYRLGEARAAAGVGITEAIDDLAVLFRAAGYEAAPIRAIRSLCEGWTANSSPTLNAPTMTDAESGLGTCEYLTQRLAEAYGQASRRGCSVQDTHALVMVDVSVENSDPWHRMSRNAAIGSALRNAYGEGHPMARMGDGLYAVLVERNEAMGPGIASLRHHISHQASALKSSNLMRQPPRVWIESLPQSYQFAVELVESLQR